MVGTDGYQAPEITFLEASHDVDRYSEKCDIWSYGCLVFNLLSGNLPFPTLSSLYAFWTTGVNDELTLLMETNYEAWLFIKKLLEVEPRKRPTAAQALKKGSCWLKIEATRQDESDDGEIDSSPPATPRISAQEMYLKEQYEQLQARFKQWQLQIMQQHDREQEETHKQLMDAERHAYIALQDTKRMHELRIQDLRERFERDTNTKSGTVVVERKLD